ncbi:TMV resistance protein N-like [Pyrus ussuriensis x Pyrus communis]|uniref:TMV resistance protein N-like n=1 Tax=Pyrus ussuriensis x Pyrus communis TaxID=2448454 RepID=A0A5N5F5N8_9ROSA|nr:TMV resistance protein N-like [Pyrus ussuriensis x Pyrus communis]
MNLGDVGAVFHDEASSYVRDFVHQISLALNPTMVELLTSICSFKQRSSSMDLIMEDMGASLRSFEASQICYVRCFANVAAERIAKLAT